ncbi:hypothetical protein SELMODRAFT_409378 [Selaginella moellendorffii]|uniref:Uncharacterized protein n=1 Tax=Selaginella moellendorffii TaxID=88036 RepID=D8RB96_SELML|nr:hypothetical protein SELMODRAFT_409378 [Selaginella moellendorffii]
MAAASSSPSPTPNANASVGAFEALHDCTAVDSPDRWLTCNMEYGNFYKLSRPASAAVARRAEALAEKQKQQQQQRPQTVPNLNLEALHEKCEKKWELLTKQLEECRSEVEQLRLQKRDQKPESPRISPRSNKTCREEYYDDETPLTTSRCEHDRAQSSPGRSSYGDRESPRGQKAYEGKIYVGKKDDTGRRSPAHKVFNICIRRSPSRDNEEDSQRYEEKNQRYEDKRQRYEDKHQQRYEDKQSQRYHQEEDLDDDEFCDKCKMMERPGSSQMQLDDVIPPPRPRRVKKKWRKQRQDRDQASDSSVHPATSKYNYYKYYGHGAKTSWGHNFPLGLIPPHSVRAPPELVVPEDIMFRRNVY